MTEEYDLLIRRRTVLLGTGATAVARVSPYSTNTVPRTTLAQDGIYGDGGAAAGLMTVTGSTTAGYTGSRTLGIDQG